MAVFELDTHHYVRRIPSQVVDLSLLLIAAFGFFGGPDC
jgi:hypothetical protein